MVLGGLPGLGGLLSTASEVAAPVLEAARSLIAGPKDRRAHSSETRTHLEVRGMHVPRAEEAARALESRLTDREGVHGAEVNAVLGRVVIAHEPEVAQDELARVIAEVESEHELAGTAPGSAHHPGNAGPVVREAGALCLSLVGLGYSAATSLLPVRGLRPSPSAMISLADSVPWMRAMAESTLGRSTTDAAFSLGGALSQTLEANPLSLLTGSAQRFCSARETIARQQAWQRWERSAAGTPGAHRAEHVPVEARPARLPDGPVERVANVTGAVALTGYAGTLAAARSPGRALAVLTAGVPRAGSAGRSAFASQLVTGLSDRGTVVFDPDAFRRLDRVDTVVFDAPMLVTERRSVESLYPFDDTGPLDETAQSDETAESGALFARATELVDPTAPRTRQRDGEWSTAPVSDFPRMAGQARSRARAEADRGADVLVLCHRSRPVALVSVIAELDPLAEALVEAAGCAGQVLVAGRGSRLDRRLPVDGLIAGGNRLAGSVRQLQSENAVVVVVSQRARSALAGADLGIGVPTAADAMPWGAHVVCQNRTEVHTLLSAMDLARQVSRRSSALTVAGSTLGLLFGWLGPVTGASARASMPVQASTLFALGLGTWAGMRAAGRAPPAPRGRTPWHAMPADAVLTLLASSEQGLEPAEVRRRQPPPEHASAATGVLGASLQGLANPMTPVLGTGAVVSAGLGSVVDAVMIMTVLVGGAAVDGIHQVRTDRELRQLLESGQLPVRVRRAGSTSTLPADQLVVGDVVELHSGDGVPADCRLLDCDGLEVDESSLTGESQLAAKSEQPTAATALGDRTCMLYQGTAVATGSATAVVVATGASTEVGQATQENGTAEAEASGVQRRLATLTRRTLPLSTGAGAALFAVDVLRGSPLGGAVTRAVGLAVAAVPEGLPFVATVAELAAARRLSTRGVLVRSPATIEALGRVDALCFDKTGTLTQGRIALRRVSDGRTEREPERLDERTHEILETAVRASPRDDGERPLPHPTDEAVLDGGRRAGIRAEHHPRELLAELPFEPSRGYHAARWDPGNGGGRLSVKGAPEVVLDRCAGWQHPDGWVRFDGSARAAVEDEVERLALAGYRVLAVAQRHENSQRHEESGQREQAGAGTADLDESEVDGLDLLGLLALADPVHPTAAEAVGRLHQAGVDLMMITGDHPSTAEAIAVELDLLDGRRVITGGELDEMDDEQLTAELPKIAVFARVSPAQKARIVRQLRAADRIVAMTGDGANDVPAIRLAQVGIALGSRATPAARESADLVIGDDRIETITAAVVEGRGMWASVHDAISILLGGNLGEIAYALGTGLFGGSGALNARQLLVVNMLTDVLPALAIAVRPPPDATPDALLAEGPEASLGSALNRDVYARAGATAGAAGLAWLVSRPMSTPAQARTAGLVALVSAQLGQTVAMRGRTPMVLVASGASLLVLLGLVQLPGVSQFFGSQPLLLHQWAVALGAAGLATTAMLLWQARFRVNGRPPAADRELPGPDGVDPA